VITALILLGLIGLGLIMLSGRIQGPLSSWERLYFWCAPLPCVLTLLLPSFLGMQRPGDEAARLWSNRLTAAGYWLSGALILAGIWLLLARRARGQRSDLRLNAGLFLASLPVLLIALIYLLFASWRWTH
jgi:hypothetical protein